MTITVVLTRGPEDPLVEWAEEICGEAVPAVEGLEPEVKYDRVIGFPDPVAAARRITVVTTPRLTFQDWRLARTTPGPIPTSQFDNWTYKRVPIPGFRIEQLRGKQAILCTDDERLRELMHGLQPVDDVTPHEAKGTIVYGEMPPHIALYTAVVVVRQGEGLLGYQVHRAE